MILSVLNAYVLKILICSVGFLRKHIFGGLAEVHYNLDFESYC